MYFDFCLPVWATQGLSWVFLINFDIFVNSFWPTCHLSDTRLSDTLLSDTRLSDKNVLFVSSFCCLQQNTELKNCCIKNGLFYRHKKSAFPIKKLYTVGVNVKKIVWEIIMNC